MKNKQFWPNTCTVKCCDFTLNSVHKVEGRLKHQTSLKNSVRAVGTGLHSGQLIKMHLKPAPPNTGIVFLRTDLSGASVCAHLDNVDFNALQLATSLRTDEMTVQTTEHLLSAFYGMGVDNAVVELDGAEVPIMDGSAEPFLLLIEEAGIRQQAAYRKTLRIEKAFTFEMSGKSIEVLPCEEYRVSYEINFDHPLIRTQRKRVVINSGHYETGIAPARTFGFLKDVNFLKSIGLIKGGSLENAVVLDGDHILNESLRLNDEFVSHKILDLVGDLSLCGYRLQGHFHVRRAGHEVHAHFLRALLASDCFSIQTFEPETKQVTFPVPSAVLA